MKTIPTTLLLLSLLALSAVGASLTLTWTDNADNETSQQIERAIDGGNFVLLAEVGPNVETFEDNMVVPGVPNTYRVRAGNAGGWSDYSNEATATPIESPNSPTSLTIPAQSRLINISGRGQVGVDADIHIGGFVISGTQPLQVLIRGIGPGLSRFNVPGLLEDPQLTLFRNPQTEIASNDDWSGQDIADASAAVFAFSVPAGSKDAALLVTLDPGQYTVHLSGVGGSTGVALLEIYEVP